MLIELNGGQHTAKTNAPAEPVNGSVNDELFRNSGNFIDQNTSLPKIEESSNMPPIQPEPRNVVSELVDIAERKGTQQASKVQRVAEILPEGQMENRTVSQPVNEFNDSQPYSNIK